MADNSVSVQVALRIRPLIETETSRGCQPILETIADEQQVVVKGTDKAFTFNYVFDPSVSQQEFYESAVRNIVRRLFKGYNVTILAYGQTGSGKTHSMGTSYTGERDMGVIPRAVNDIFAKIECDDEYEYKVTVSFMELYQESLYDLLADRPRDQCIVDIREDLKGIKIPNLTEEEVSCSNDTLKCLIRGSQGRVTGATAMNAQSSRSHAIFTISLHRQKKNDENSAISAKFHLVDLAGSERSKKTKATGDRFKEGVNINKGLLALGNVISALGEENPKGTGYISYRDSKLTRLLQDSLGGNSITLMVACVSPADYNMDETISTLRYADRARKIKNKPIVNQDPRVAEIIRLNNHIKQLQLQLLERGPSTMSSEDVDTLRDENDRLRVKNRKLTEQLQNTINDYTSLFEKALIAENAKERLQRQLEELETQSDVTLQQMNLTAEQAVFYKQVQEKIEDIKYHNRLTDAEILKHDVDSSIEPIEPGSMDADSQINFDKKQESHTMQQLAFSTQLQELTKALALKEQLASQIATNVNNLVDYDTLRENEGKISALEREKDELMQQLKNAKSLNTCSKLSEQRRKRVQELESQIGELNRKVVEQARLIKLKEKDDMKIKQLNMEIQSMKQQKVKLVKLMKSEADKYRQWRIERERELSKLRDQDRKLQNQMVKMEYQHAKQQTVLKRKVEEAAAINKRLKDALALQKATQERRHQNHGKTERVQQWVAQELEVLVSTVEAEQTLEHLVEDRAVLAAQRDALNPAALSPNKLTSERKRLDEEIDLRSTQIADLQQKIVDSDQENKSKTRWDVVQSMVEAKCALKYLFEVAADIKRNAIKTKNKLKEVKTSREEEIGELKSALSTAERKLKEATAQHNKIMTETVKDHEEKVAVLLSQLRNGDGGEDAADISLMLNQACCDHADQLREMGQLKDELESFKSECESLRENMKKITEAAAMNHSRGSPKQNNDVTFNVPTIKMKKEKKESVWDAATVYVDDSPDENSFEDDEENDPDWRKTPVFKRLQKIKRQTLRKSPLPEADDTENAAIKRTSDGQTKCSCRGNCMTKQCGCRKLTVSCSTKCKCSASCRNNNSSDNKKLFDSSENDSIENNDDDTFKKPRFHDISGLNKTFDVSVRKKIFPD